MLLLPEEGWTLLCYLTSFLQLHLHGVAGQHKPPPGTTAAGTLSPVSVSHCAQASAGAIHKIRREMPPMGCQQRAPAFWQVWVARELGVLMGAHLGHTSQLGSGVGQGHCSTTVPGDSSWGQIMLPRAHTRAASAKVIPGKKACLIFSERYPVRWASRCL